MTDIITTPTTIPTTNANTDILSRLLGLPSEVRVRIWEYALGGFILHTGEWLTDEAARWGDNQPQRFIEHRNFIEYINANTLNDQAIQGGRTYQRHLNRLDQMPVSVTVCLAGTTDDEDARERHVGAAQYPTAFQRHQAAARLAASGRHKHSRCTDRTRGNRLNLSLLRVCRLIYREACFISFTHNTFIFDGAHRIPEFLDVLRSHSIPTPPMLGHVMLARLPWSWSWIPNDFAAAVQALPGSLSRTRLTVYIELSPEDMVLLSRPVQQLQVNPNLGVFSTIKFRSLDVHIANTAGRALNGESADPPDRNVSEQELQMWEARMEGVMRRVCC
ncbi:hypothetical protein LTR17_020940 [Elasticomyces elasticus]|nr:hypothetical protein LTR17_020940 [Elasticomyces elasticus]